MQKLHAIISAAMSTGDVTVLANAIPPGSPQATAAAAAMAARRGGFMAEGNVTGAAALDFITPGVPVATGNAAAARESAATAVGELVLQGKSVMEVWVMYQEMVGVQLAGDEARWRRLLGTYDFVWNPTS